MANDSVIIKLDGTVSVADFRTVVNGLADLLLALTAETNSEAAVDWQISGLKVGSAEVISRGVFGNPESMATVSLVVEKYANVAKAASQGKIDRFSDPVREAMLQITQVVNGKIPRVLMGTPSEPAMASIERPLEEVEYLTTARAKPRPYARAAVKGKIVTLDDKHALYFTLQEAYSQQHIRCYPGKDHRANLGKYWENKSWIIVEGTYIRYGDKPTLNKITDIVELPNGQKGGWRKAIGIAPRGPDAQDISPADAVRKVRDAEA